MEDSAWKNDEVNLSDVLYGCETWSLTLKEEQISKVSENRVLWGIKLHEGGKLHND
jgi:hypothetical protein